MQISRMPLTAKSQANKTVPLDLLEADLAVTKAAARQKTPGFLDAPKRSAASGRQVQQTPWSEKNSNQLIGTEDPP